MPLPQEYNDAYALLVAFRQKIFNDLVSGRVKAVLDASHDTMVKFDEQIGRFSVLPYMFGNVKRRAVALQLNARNVGVGEISVAKANYALEKAMYPLNTPYNQATRMLPKVDIFKYTPPSDIEIIEKSGEEVWASLFILQTEKNYFTEVADAENVGNDFYKFRAIGRVKIIAGVSNGLHSWDDYTTLEGEATVLVREVTDVSDGQIKTYDMHVFLDARYINQQGAIQVVPLVVHVTDSTITMPEHIIMAGGKRLISTEKGLFTGNVVSGQLIGWGKTHGSVSITTKTTLWANASVLLIGVNNVSFGTTDPVPARYDKKATDEVLVTADPYTGYSVKNWELDGSQFPATDTFTVKCYRDHELICVFIAGGVVIFRPSGVGDVTELSAHGDSPNYKCVDEVVHDGNTTFVSHTIPSGFQEDLYVMADPTIADGNIIEHVELFFRIMKAGDLPYGYGKLLLKIGGMKVYSEAFEVAGNYELFSKKYTVNPVTGQAWTKSEVLALQCGCALEYQLITSTGNWYTTRCTQLWAEVEHHPP